MEGVLGEIKIVGFNFAPRNWKTCQGQLLAVTQYTSLYSLLGTIYGGDGRSTFGLPDLRGRVPVGEGTGPGLSKIRLGQTGGSETTTLTTANLPSHNHPLSTFEAQIRTGSNNQSVVVKEQGTGSGETGNNGGSQASNNRSPYLGLNYVICVEGTYPTRT